MVREGIVLFFFCVCVRVSVIMKYSEEKKNTIDERTEPGWKSEGKGGWNVKVRESRKDNRKTAYRGEGRRGKRRRKKKKRKYRKQEDEKREKKRKREQQKKVLKK